MWIIDNLQSTVKRSIEMVVNKSLDEEKSSNSTLLIYIEVAGKWRVRVNVPMWTTIKAIKNIIRRGKITDKSDEEMTVIFQGKKLVNDYWTLRDYQVDSFSKLLVNLHKRIPAKINLPIPIQKIEDDVRRAIVKKRLASRRIDDMLNFTLLHSLYDPSSSESCYDVREVSDLQVLETSSQSRPTGKSPKPKKVIPE